MKSNFLSSSEFCVRSPNGHTVRDKSVTRRESVSECSETWLGFASFHDHSNPDPHRTAAYSCGTFRHLRGSVPTMPSVAVIIPLMDRSADLRFSLPRLLHQDFEHYTVCLVDNSSIDDFDRVLLERETLGGTIRSVPRPGIKGSTQEGPSRLVVIRRPRPTSSRSQFRVTAVFALPRATCCCSSTRHGIRRTAHPGINRGRLPALAERRW